MHVADDIAEYDTFCAKMIALLSRFKFESAYCVTLRNLRQASAEFVTAHAARTTDFCTHVYANYFTDNYLSLAVNYFKAGIADVSSRSYLQQKRARQNLN